MVPVTAALAGFDCHYSKELNTFTDLSLHMNECPIHQNLQLESIVLIDPRTPVFLKMIDFYNMLIRLLKSFYFK